MIFDGAMTLVALDCWYSRLAGAAPDNALEQFCAEQFDNQWMENRFESTKNILHNRLQFQAHR